jgi:hypothetical protein
LSLDISPHPYIDDLLESNCAIGAHSSSLFAH